MEQTREYNSALEETSPLMKGKIDINLALDYMLAGNSILTFVNTQKNTHLTYKIKKAKDRDIFFVSALCGPDNTSDYKYFGCIKKDINGNIIYEYSVNAKIKQNAETVKSFEHVLSHILAKHTFKTLEIWHSTHCCKCGKLLTVESSIMKGMGPVCGSRYVKKY